MNCSLLIASYHSPFTPHVSLSHRFLSLPMLPITVHRPFPLHTYPLPPLHITIRRFLSLSHRFLSIPTAYYPCSTSSITLTVSYHSPLLSLYSAHRFISPSVASYHSPLLPITTHRFLSLPTAFYHSPPLPITVHRFQSLSAASYHYPPLPITPHSFLSPPAASYHYPSLPVASTLNVFNCGST